MSTISGTGPDVVLVHGVGVGPESFSATAASLIESGRKVYCVSRAGYGVGAVTGDQYVDLDHEVEIIIESFEERKERPVVWVGVSGGATLGVIAASRRPTSIECAVLHEPLIGPRSGALHDAIQTAARQLATGLDDRNEAEIRAVAFMEALVGPAGWDALGPAGRDLVGQRAGLVHSEVPRFAAFEAREVPDETVSVLITVGERSPKLRHEAAARAADLLHGQVVVIPGVGHLPQVEAPDVFAEIIRGNS
jgi:pimeloyl-ACP methyl ester carboxylesterase